MKPASPTTRRTLFLGVSLWLAAALHAFAQTAGGIPEPGLVLYGTANRVTGNTTNRLMSGTLAWQFQSADNGTTLAVVTPLTNLDNSLSFAFELPFETLVAEGTDSPNALNLSALATNYTRSSITIDGEAARIVAGSLGRLTNFTFGLADRGMMERLDLEVGTAAETYAQWSQRYFGIPNADPNADPDGDHLTNQAEFAAGTDPTNPASVLKFVGIHKNPGGPGLVLEWLSATNKTYKLERTTSLSTGFTALQTGVAATPGTNAFTDTTATVSATYFYRLTLEP